MEFYCPSMVSSWVPGREVLLPCLGSVLCSNGNSLKVRVLSRRGAPKGASTAILGNVAFPATTETKVVGTAALLLGLRDPVFGGRAQVHRPAVSTTGCGAGGPGRLGLGRRRRSWLAAAAGHAGSAGYHVSSHQSSSVRHQKHAAYYQWKYKHGHMLQESLGVITRDIRARLTSSFSPNWNLSSLAASFQFNLAAIVTNLA